MEKNLKFRRYKLKQSILAGIQLIIEKKLVTMNPSIRIISLLQCMKEARYISQEVAGYSSQKVTGMDSESK